MATQRSYNALISRPRYSPSLSHQPAASRPSHPSTQRCLSRCASLALSLCTPSWHAQRNSHPHRTSDTQFTCRTRCASHMQCTPLALCLHTHSCHPHSSHTLFLDPLDRHTRCSSPAFSLHTPSSAVLSREARPAFPAQRAGGSGAEVCTEPGADGPSAHPAERRTALGSGGASEPSADETEAEADGVSVHSADSRQGSSTGASPRTSAERQAEPGESLPSMQEIIASVRSKGVDVVLSEFGPFFTLEATSVATGERLGSANGFVRPTLRGMLLHLDTIRLEGMGMRRAPGVRTVLGMGFFMGAVLVRHGIDRGCARAELLAINDNDEFHAKLVRYYQRLGWRVTDVVTGERLSDMGHMLVWGGVGTKMECIPKDILAKWSKQFTVAS